MKDSLLRMLYAALTGDHICKECGGVMSLEGDVFVCPKCGYSVDDKDFGDGEDSPDVDELTPEEEDAFEEYGRIYGIDENDPELDWHD